MKNFDLTIDLRVRLWPKSPPSGHAEAVAIEQAQSAIDKAAHEWFAENSSDIKMAIYERALQQVISIGKE